MIDIQMTRTCPEEARVEVSARLVILYEGSSDFRRELEDLIEKYKI